MQNDGRRQRISPLSLKGLTFIVIAVLLPLLILELAVRVLYNQELSRKIIHSPIAHFNERGHLRPVPGAEWIDQTFEYQTHYKIGEHGFRVRLDDTKTNQVEVSRDQRILFLGDSFTFGTGNEARETYVEIIADRMRQHAPETTVINAGFMAYDQAMEYHLLEELFQEFPARLVVIGFLPNDLFDNRPLEHDFNVEERENIVATKELDFRYQTLECLKSLLMGIDPLYVKLYEKTGRAKLFATQSDAAVTQQLETTQELFRAILGLCEKHHATLIVASLPQLFQVLKKEDERFSPFTLDRYFAEVAESDGYHWIETLTTMRKAARSSDDATHYRVDGHLTPAGNTMVADAQTEALVKIWAQDEPSH